MSESAKVLKSQSFICRPSEVPVSSQSSYWPLLLGPLMPLKIQSTLVYPLRGTIAPMSWPLGLYTVNPEVRVISDGYLIMFYIFTSLENKIISEGVTSWIIYSFRLWCFYWCSCSFILEYQDHNTCSSSRWPGETFDREHLQYFTVSCVGLG